MVTSRKLQATPASNSCGVGYVLAVQIFQELAPQIQPLIERTPRPIAVAAHPVSESQHRS